MNPFTDCISFNALTKLFFGGYAGGTKSEGNYCVGCITVIWRTFHPVEMRFTYLTVPPGVMRVQVVNVSMLGILCLPERWGTLFLHSCCFVIHWDWSDSYEAQSTETVCCLLFRYPVKQQTQILPRSIYSTCTRLAGLKGKSMNFLSFPAFQCIFICKAHMISNQQNAQDQTW